MESSNINCSNLFSRSILNESRVGGVKSSINDPAPRAAVLEISDRLFPLLSVTVVESATRKLLLRLVTSEEKFRRERRSKFERGSLTVVRSIKDGMPPVRV